MRKTAILAGLLSAGMFANAEANVIGDIISAVKQRLSGQQEKTTRIVSENRTYAESNYKTAVEYIKIKKYDEALDMLIKIIDLKDPQYSLKAGEWLNKKIWMDIAQNKPKIVETELAVSRIFYQTAAGLASVDPKRKELLIKARKHLDNAINDESQLDFALTRMEKQR